MKIKFYIFFLTMLFCASTMFSQQRPIKKPTPKPDEQTESIAIQQVLKKVPTQKVVVEKTNGDRLTGLFVGGDTENVTIEVSGTNIQIPAGEISNLQFGEPNPKVETQVVKDISLDIEVALIFKSGDAVPVSRSSILFLDKSAVDLMREAGVPPERGSSPEESLLLGYFFARLRGNTATTVFSRLLAEHTKFSATTDFTGKVSIKNPPSGQYYLYMLSEIRKANVIWNLPVQIKDGESLSLTLDQNNAALAF